MGVVIFIIIVIAVVYFISHSNTTTTGSQNRSSVQVSTNRNATTYRGYIKTDITTKKAFVMYVLMSVYNLGDKWNQHIIYEGDEIWAKDIVEKAFDIIATNAEKNYVRKGIFNLYKGQELADENKVFMDMFEILIFGSNNIETNRIDLFSQEEQMNLRLAVHAIHNLLMSDDEKLAESKRELAESYDETFTTSSYDKVDTNSGKTAGAIFEKYYKKLLPIIQKSPFSHPTDKEELVCSMCALSDFVAMSAEKDRIECVKSIQLVLRKICPDVDFNKIGERMDLYGEVLRGKPLRGLWYSTIGDINNDVMGAASKITALLGDALFRPECLEDYFSEEQYFVVVDATKRVDFINEVMTPLLNTMKEFANELAE